MVDHEMSSRLLQLNQARALVETDPSYYQQIVVGVLPVFDDVAADLRRWVADFVLSALSNSKLTALEREDLALKCLTRLSEALAKEKDDQVSKCFIQLSSAMYPLLFRHVAHNPQSSNVWDQLTFVKTTIMNKWDAASNSLGICCIKFAQRVIAAQTIGTKDPRLSNKDDVSLAIVMAKHPTMNEHQLADEANSLLDRIIAMLSKRPMNSVIASAALNSLFVLVKTRNSLGPKIIPAILSCNISRFTLDAGSLRDTLNYKFVDKTIRVVLTTLLKINAAGSSGTSIQQYLVKQAQNSQEENFKKRQAPDSVESNGKRLRTDIDGEGTPQPSILSIPPLPDGEVTLATVFNLANDNALAAFDVKQLPLTLVVQIITATLAAINTDHLCASINTTRARHVAVRNRPVPLSRPLLDQQETLVLPSKLSDDHANSPEPPVAVINNSFSMPEPSDRTEQELRKQFEICTRRILHNNFMSKSSQSLVVTRDSGLHRILGATWDRETWSAVTTRLASRAALTKSSVASKLIHDFCPADHLREQFLAHSTGNFRDNMDFCSSWLNEEWYASLIKQEDSLSPEAPLVYDYEYWTNKVLDAVLPFLDAGDRFFMRFVSELPVLTDGMITKLRTLCVDPDRAQLGYTTLHYLIMLRPPVRNYCLDFIQQLYQEDKSEIVQQSKILKRWRPTFLSEQTTGMSLAVDTPEAMGQ